MKAPSVRDFSVFSHLGNIGISAKVRYKQVFSMKLSYFLEIFLQRSYMNVCSLQWAYVA